MEEKRKKKISLRTVDGLKKRLAGLGLHTICAEALCPNISECYGRLQATFLILGRVCTRDCGFCNVQTGLPEPPDPGEPGRLVEACRRLGLRYVVVTSPTRDDLPDGGAGAFVRAVRALREDDPGRKVELLIPDFQGSGQSIAEIADAAPDVVGHNLETVRRLYGLRRAGFSGGPRADYERSLQVLKKLSEAAPDLPTKSALMLGLGETPGEVLGALEDLRDSGCRRLCLGQYLAPSRKHHPVVRRLGDEEFADWRVAALKLGFERVQSGPFVRSSYRADQDPEQGQ